MQSSSTSLMTNIYNYDALMACNKDIYIILDNYHITYYNKLYNTLI